MQKKQKPRKKKETSSQKVGEGQYRRILAAPEATEDRGDRDREGLSQAEQIVIAAGGGGIPGS